MTSYPEYLAANERLRRVESGEEPNEIYHRHADGGCPLICDDKATIYDAERDATPATVEWCAKSIGMQQVYPHSPSGRTVMCAYGFGAVICLMSDSTIVLRDYLPSLLHVRIDNPTRGDVITALRLFGGAK